MDPHEAEAAGRHLSREASGRPIGTSSYGISHSTKDAERHARSEIEHQRSLELPRDRERFGDQEHERDLERTRSTDRGHSAQPAIAYFSMEIALRDDIPTYSGGLGVLAGDFLRSAADLGLPMVAVTLLYRDGYFVQVIDPAGNQSEDPVHWSPSDVLEHTAAQVTIEIEGRDVAVGAWRLVLGGVGGHEVPVYFLDTSIAGNDPGDQGICSQLYGGDQRTRLHQEAVLGLAGPPMLAALGHGNVVAYHMNEGHSALLTLTLLERELEGAPIDLASEDLAAARARCVFTTHTPVPAGHDRFPVDLVSSVLGERHRRRLEEIGAIAGGELNMTVLGMALSRFVNGVSLKHRSVTREMFPGADITSVTNGVHVAQWAAPSTAALFDRHFPDWRAHNAMLRYATAIPLAELDLAHRSAKHALVAAVLELTGRQLDPEALTIGLARRAASYKQMTLLFEDLERLGAIAEANGPLQVVAASKAHPADLPGKALINRIFVAAARLAGRIEVVFLPNYDLRLGSLLTAGTDLWLNNPSKPYEASGTSGMKAAINGVPSLSTLDGWWIEGWIEGVTGWSIGGPEPSSAAEDAAALYAKLESVVAPLFFSSPQAYLEVQRSTIALNGSWFSTERMVREYAVSAYRIGERSLASR